MGLINLGKSVSPVYLKAGHQEGGAGPFTGLQGRRRGINKAEGFQAGYKEKLFLQVDSV